MRLAIACYLALRVAIAATLAYAVLPEAWFVASAAALDAIAALSRKRTRVLAYEVAARVVLLWFAHWRWGGVLDSRGHAGVATWLWGRIGVVLITFAPVAIGRTLRSLLFEPWTNPRVGDAERTRRGLVAIGCCLVVVSLCVSRLLRMPAVRNIAIASTAAGAGFLLAAAARRVPRATRDSSAYRSAPVASPAPLRLRLSLFALLAVSATVMFDTACWHGSGWIPARHAVDGDGLFAPILHTEDHLVEWIAPWDPPTQMFWDTDHARFESDRDQFVRMVKKTTTPPQTLAYYLPGAAHRQECDFVLQKVGPNVPEHERDRVFDPYVRDARLHFTCRRPDRGLAYCSITLDGAWTGCSPA